MQGNLFYGCGTALVTPFRGNRIDFDALENLIDGQIDADIDALVVLGTTGEPESISEAERSAIIECALARCARRVPMIVGTGANDTRTAIRRAVEAQMLGADALLVVTPYYNRASNQGLIEHYTAIADRVEIPIIMYNVPSRTGVNLEPRVVAELAKHPMLCALKDACTDAAHMTDMARLCGDGIAIYSGSDECVLQALALGAHGLISVAANVIGDARADDELDPRRHKGLPQPRLPLDAAHQLPVQRGQPHSRQGRARHDGQARGDAAPAAGAARRRAPRSPAPRAEAPVADRIAFFKRQGRFREPSRGSAPLHFYESASKTLHRVRCIFHSGEEAE